MNKLAFSSVSDDNLFAADTGDNHRLVILSRDLEVNQEIVEDLSDLFRLIFMNEVTNLIEHNKLEFALHLSNCEIFIHPVTSS